MNKVTSGWANGLLGVLIFSGSLPATRVAVAEFDPFFLTSARASIAAVFAFFLLAIFRQPIPERQDILPLIIVAAGVVIGFPLFTALALQYVTSAHSIVFIGLLPLFTALFGVLRAKERLKPLFWIFSGVGSIFVAGFSIKQGFQASLIGDTFMMVAIIVCGLAYAEGAKLSHKLGGWQVISWALVLSLPIMAVLSLYTMPKTLVNLSIQAWAGLAYVSLFSMLIGFVFWYRGLAQGGISAIGQLQLLQPFFGLILAAVILNETVDKNMIVTSIGVIICVAGTKRFAK